MKTCNYLKCIQTTHFINNFALLTIPMLKCIKCPFHEYSGRWKALENDRTLKILHHNLGIERKENSRSPRTIVR